MIYDAVIIGAGPSGSYLAKKLADNKLKVCVIEKEKEIGYPIACTGLFTSKIKKFVNMDNSFVINKLKKVTLHSKNNKLTINSQEFVVDRAKGINEIALEDEALNEEFIVLGDIEGDLRKIIRARHPDGLPRKGGEKAKLRGEIKELKEKLAAVENIACGIEKSVIRLEGKAFQRMNSDMFVSDGESSFVCREGSIKDGKRYKVFAVEDEGGEDNE